MSRAIVLSGGGSVGIAWQTGLVAGLAGAGVDLRTADTVVGTSAGAAVGAQIALGRDMARAMERYARPAARDGGRSTQAPRRAARRAGQGLEGLMTLMAQATTSGGGAREVRAAIGRHALAASTIDEELFVRGFAHLAAESWPASFSCTAVDAESGEFMVWDASSKVELPRAVASSCAVPGLFPPITLRGKRYMDGGMRSGTNADLAKGSSRVLIISLLGRRAAREGDAADAARFERHRERARRELAVLRESGAQVEQVGPDDEASTVMGMDLMNPALTHDAAQAGLRQGRVVADRLRAFWV